MFFAGIDSGSTTTKLCVINNAKKIVFFDIVKTGFDPEEKVNILFKKFEAKTGTNRSEIANIVSTGYGGRRFSSRFVSEITCHSIGTHYFFPEINHIIDVGGQDIKAIVKNRKGKPVDFNLNDKCAAGTGRFIEVMASIFDTTPEGFNELCRGKSFDDFVKITSFCTVFAETEVVGLLSKKIDKHRVICGVLRSIAEKTINFSYSIFQNMPEKIVFSGGAAKIKPVVWWLEKLSEAKISVPTTPQITGALGAALIAQEKYYGNK